MPVVQDLHLVSLGSFPAAAHHYLHRPKGLPEAILIHCLRGRGWCRLDGKKWPLDEGKAIFIPPGQPHAYAADEHQPWTIHWLHIAGKRVDAYLSVLGVSSRQPLINLLDTAGLVQAFERLYGLLDLGYTESNLLALSTELGRFLALLKTHQTALHHKGRLAEEKIRASMAFMREHLRDALTLKSLAAAVHMSVPHYASLFKRQTHTSPILFLIRLRMQRACELLTTTDLPIKAVCREVGYADPFYFCRIFKKTIGQSPGEYRRMVRI
jgi:AraC family transcriptional regulator, arabinose operon regulatory protein